MWVDEFKTQIQSIDLLEPKNSIQNYQTAHAQFVKIRADALNQQIIKHKAYIVDQMKAYKNGQRTHTIMVDIAKRMSDEEVDAVANFIQGLH